MDSSARLSCALACARRGWYVFPCAVGNKRPHSVLAPHGFKDASTDDALIRKWWEREPDANIGIATGAFSGFFAVDVDPRHGGDKTWDALGGFGGVETGIVRTPGGGFHGYFRMPLSGVRSSVGQLGAGLDVRGDGGYVMAPGSETEAGEYVWELDTAPAEAPSWLRARLATMAAERVSGIGSTASTIPEGQRNATLTRLAGAMRRKDADPESIEAALQEENRRRCDPPLPEREVTTIARSVGRYGPANDSAAPRERVSAERIRLRTAADLSADAFAVPPFVIPGYIARQCITEITGAPKRAGKTTFVAYAVRAILDGAPFLGLSVARGPVVWLTEEGPATFSQPLGLAGLLGRKDLYYLSRHDARGLAWPEVIAQVISEGVRVGAILLIIDTLPAFAQMHGDSENNAGDALRALEPLKTAAAIGLAVVVIRHERKGGGAIGESGRGSSAFTGAVDICLSLRKPDGQSRNSIRLLEGLSRFRETAETLLIDLTDVGYVSLGTESAVATAEARRTILDFLPASALDAMQLDDILVRGADAKLSRTTIQAALTALMAEGVVSRLGKGRKGNPYRYHLVSAGTSTLGTGRVPGGES